MRGRGAAAAAHHVDQARLGEFADKARRVFRRLVILAEFVGQAGVRVAQTSVSATRPVRDMRAQVFGAQRAVEPMVIGLAWRTEFQNASGNCPERLRPDRSVMVPEIITGTWRRVPRKFPIA
jgi:hypothetical protein